MKAKIKVGKILIAEANKAVEASFEGIRCAVSDALTAKVRAEANDASIWPWVQNMYNDSVVYSIGGEYFQRTYTLTGDVVDFGAAVEVELVYVPVTESVAIIESGNSVQRTRVLVGLIQSLSESYNPTTGEATITVIAPGFNKGKGRYYPADVLKRDYNIFEGAKMFTDHQTDAESRVRPEGSLKDWVGSIKKVWAESDGTIRANAAIIDPPFKAKLEELAKNNMLKDMGVSIRAIGEARKEKVEGVETNYVESLLKARSVDFVTYAGAGGQVEALMTESDGENDVDLMSEAQLRVRRPDLLQLIESRTEKEHQMSVKTLEQQLTEAQALSLKEKERADGLQKQLDESAKVTKKIAAATELTKLLSEAKTLPEPAKAKLKAQFAEATEVTGMKEAIDAEIAYVKSIAPASSSSIVRNMGESVEREGTLTDEDKKKRLQEGFAGMGLTKEQAEIAAR
jgi:hypothetical protein